MQKHIYLIGDPVEHSVSPQMHNAAFKAMGLDHEYKALRVRNEEELDDNIAEFRKNAAGFNVTVPHKESVLTYLDEIDDFAKKIGAVNTVKNSKGKLKGYNTDSDGFLMSLIDDAGYDPKGKKVVLLGAGGAAKAVSFALGRSSISELSIFDVDGIKTEELEADLCAHFKSKISGIYNIDVLKQNIGNADLLVNTTPVGMSPNIDHCPVDADMLHQGLFVYDIVYNPAETKLLKLAKEKGANGITGIGMLVRQGAAAFKIFTGKEAPFDVMMEAAKKALKV